MTTTQFPENETVPNSTNVLTATTGLSALISERTFNTFTFVGMGIFAPIVCALGITGNSIGMFVLTKNARYKRNAVYVYMLALMLNDSIYLILGIIVSIIHVVELYDWYLIHLVQIYNSFLGAYLDIVLNHISTALLIIMSLERLLAITFPFRINKSFLLRYPRTLILIWAVISATYTSPFLTSFDILSYTDAENRTIFKRTFIEERQNLFFLMILVETVLLHYICPVVVLVTSVLILCSYSRMVKTRSSLFETTQTENNQQRKITIMVLGVAGMYVLMSLPNLAIQTLFFIDNNFGYNGAYKRTFFLLINFGNHLSQINAASNFFIYILASRNYRSTFRSLFGKSIRRDRNITISTIT